MRAPYFVLGAQDPEMRAIEKVLQAQGVAFGYAGRAGRRGERCRSGNAYLADAVLARGRLAETVPAAWVLQADVVTVECAVERVEAVVRIDHHEPGDAGYEKGARDYLEGSSLGQVLTFFGLKPNSEQRLIAAADHCLSAAYKGLCPQVDPEELLFSRAAWKAKIANRPLSEVVAAIMHAADCVRKAYCESSGEAFFDDPFSVPTEIGEGAAYCGLPIRYRALTDDGQVKEMVKGASTEAIQAFMAMHRAFGRRVYGNPFRGYAGCYH